MVAETGTPAGDRKASWIADGYRAVYDALPRIRSIVYFDVEVPEVRAATADELAHGHAHGPGGHDH